jgi:hypothetical protein
VRGALTCLVVLDTVSVSLGVALILLVRQTWLLGLGVIIVGSLAGGALFLFKLINVQCPDCRGALRRDPTDGGYVCGRCGTAWSPPGD